MQQLDEIGFPVVSIGELLAGFLGGVREAKSRSELSRFLASSRIRVLNIDQETAEFYGGIVQALKRAGTPIPTKDVWIAALAQRHGLPVYTNDVHFKVVPGLVLME